MVVQSGEERPPSVEDMKPRPALSAPAKPFLKWAGGKRQLINELIARFPTSSEKRFTKYAEPFVGGGALFFHVIQDNRFNEYLISDANPELYITYKTIQQSVENVIIHLRALEKRYLEGDEVERDSMFYEIRRKFNSNVSRVNTKRPINATRTAQMIFLNRTCFNGLFRVNNKGEFNVPHGRYKNPIINNYTNLRTVSTLLQDVDIRCGDYSHCDEWIDENTLVYFDPPYRPLTTSSSFTSYLKSNFSDNQQEELAEYCIKLKERGAFVMTSNSDPKNIDHYDDFFEDIYHGFTFHRVQANRAINCNGDGRGAISEFIITSE